MTARCSVSGAAAEADVRQKPSMPLRRHPVMMLRLRYKVRPPLIEGVSAERCGALAGTLQGELDPPPSPIKLCKVFKVDGLSPDLVLGRSKKSYKLGLEAAKYS